MVLWAKGYMKGKIILAQQQMSQIIMDHEFISFQVIPENNLQLGNT